MYLYSFTSGHVSEKNYCEDLTETSAECRIYSFLQTYYAILKKNQYLPSYRQEFDDILSPTEGLTSLSLPVIHARDLHDARHARVRVMTR